MSKPGYDLLLVDDSEAILKILGNAFNGTEFNVKAVRNPEEAYELLQRERFQIVVSDIEMPEMNGLELLRKIKAYNGMIQVIILTGHIEINHILNAFRYGAENMFFKPFRAEEVVTACRQSAAKLDRVNRLLAEVAEARGY